MHEHHPLLTRSQFVDELTSLGYNSNAAGKLFGVLVRSAIFDGETRRSDDIGYSVPNRYGDPECVVSVPNLAAKLDEISAIENIGWMSVRMSQALTEQYVLPETCQS